METFKSVSAMLQAIAQGCRDSVPEYLRYREIAEANRELFKLLEFLETANPCAQEYRLFKGVIIISYTAHWTFFKLGRFRIKRSFRMIGLPASLPEPGYLAGSDAESQIAAAKIVKEAADGLKGMTVVLNAPQYMPGGLPGPESYAFINRFSNFEEYLASLRSPYRRKLKAFLNKGRELAYCKLNKGEFTRGHYKLYLDVCRRSPFVFRILPMEYFRECDSEIFEVRYKNALLGFVQLLGIKDSLYFMYVGFRKTEDDDETAPISSVALYYNMLLFIIRHGIQNGYKRIVFGQTSGESKRCVGCFAEPKYMYFTSSNKLVKLFFKVFGRLFAFRQTQAPRAVFKAEARYS